MDSGSSINAIDAEKLVPGAAVQKAKTASFTTANGGKIESNGQVTLPIAHAEGNTITRTFKNIKVDLPILATSAMTTSKGSVEYQEHGGIATHGPTQNKNKFLRFGDVYFMKGYLPKQICGKPSDFVRPGMA